MEATKSRKIILTEEEIAGLSWVKAQFSNHNGACVEIASVPDKIAIRDSKDPGGPVLVYTPIEFRAFLDGARNGEFDSLLQLLAPLPGDRRAPCSSGYLCSRCRADTGRAPVSRTFTRFVSCV